MQVVNAYKPGQGGIDEGGFKVIKTTDDYIYAQVPGWSPNPNSDPKPEL